MKNVSKYNKLLLNKEKLEDVGSKSSGFYYSI